MNELLSTNDCPMASGDSNVGTGPKSVLKEVVELIPSDKTDFEVFIQECRDLEMDV